jgi:hypothetical protein
MLRYVHTQRGWVHQVNYRNDHPQAPVTVDSYFDKFILIHRTAVMFLELWFKRQTLLTCLLLHPRTASVHKWIKTPLTHSTVTVALQQHDWAGCRSSDLDLHSGGARFKFRSGHRLSRQVYRCFPRILQANAGVLLQFGHNRFLPNPLEFIIRHPSYRLPIHHYRIILLSSPSSLLLLFHDTFTTPLYFRTGCDTTCPKRQYRQQDNISRSVISFDFSGDTFSIGMTTWLLMLNL